MRKLLVLFLSFTLAFCNCKKNVISNPEKIKKTTIVNSYCPEKGTCTIEILENKNLIIKTDDLGGTYYETEASNKHDVVIYKFNKNTKEGLYDGSYQEEIIFEINKSANKISFLNSDLQQTKMIFGRHCYCKGQAGYFKVTNGKLNFNKTKEEINIDLDFKITVVPQIINKITAVIK